MPQNPAIFLDRDGTIIDDVGHINNPSQVTFYPFSFQALQQLQDRFLLFIITNQSGISKGILSEPEVVTVNNYIVNTLHHHHISIRDVFYCPHTDEDHCQCRKPNPFFIQEAARRHELDLSRSFMIGDHPSDVECGINAGVTSLYLLSGHGKNHQHEINSGTRVFANLSEASKFILSTTNS